VGSGISEKEEIGGEKRRMGWDEGGRMRKGEKGVGVV